MNASCFVQFTGGDFTVQGTREQEVHADMGKRGRIPDIFVYHDPVHPDCGFFDLPTPVVKVSAEGTKGRTHLGLCLWVFLG